MANYGLKVVLAGPITAALTRVAAALRAQELEILFTVDMRQVLHDTIGAALEPYLILGVGSATLVNRALTVNREIGLFVPFHVTLRVVDDHVEVFVVDPETLFAVLDAEDRQVLGVLPEEAKQRFLAAIRTLNEGC
jgi:uncharacterized protein (DUF302 family)